MVSYATATKLLVKNMLCLQLILQDGKLANNFNNGKIMICVFFKFHSKIFSTIPAVESATQTKKYKAADSTVCMVIKIINKT